MFCLKCDRLITEVTFRLNDGICMLCKKGVKCIRCGNLTLSYVLIDGGVFCSSCKMYVVPKILAPPFLALAGEKFSGFFCRWVDTSLSASLPNAVKGICFNLTNVYDNEYAVEMIGASRFDSNDPDWGCDEAWEAMPRQIDIPSGQFGKGWEECLEGISKLILEYLASGAKSQVLKSVQGIGVRFVDGDLHVLWQK